MARSARALVVVSTVVAALVETYFATQYHPYVFWTAITGFVALLATGERVRRVALPTLMAAAYVMPAVCSITTCAMFCPKCRRPHPPACNSTWPLTNRFSCALR